MRTKRARVTVHEDQGFDQAGDLEVDRGDHTATETCVPAITAVGYPTASTPPIRGRDLLRDRARHVVQVVRVDGHGLHA